MFEVDDYIGLDVLIVDVATAFRIIDDLVWDLWGHRSYYEEYWEIEDLTDNQAKNVIRRTIRDFGIDPNARSLFIDRFQVDTSMRGRGLGTQAYKQLERNAKRAGLRYIILQASIIDFDEDIHSLPFWEKMGFRELPHTTDYPIMYKAI